MTNPSPRCLAVLLLALCWSAPEVLAGEVRLERCFIRDVDIVITRFDVTMPPGRAATRPEYPPAPARIPGLEIFPVAGEPALSPCFRERLAALLFLLRDQSADVYFLDGAIVGAGLPGRAPALGVSGGKAVDCQIPATRSDLVRELKSPDPPRWRERFDLVKVFAARGLDAALIGASRDELERGKGVRLAADGAAVYPFPPWERTATLIAAGTGPDDKVESLTGYLLFAAGRQAPLYPAARAAIDLFGLADTVSTDDNGGIGLGYFVLNQGRCLECTLMLRPVRGDLGGGNSYGFEAVGRIQDVSAQVQKPKAAPGAIAPAGR